MVTGHSIVLFKRMRRLKVNHSSWLAMATLGLGMSMGVAAQGSVVLYDSQGFEDTSTFASGTLADGAGGWIFHKPVKVTNYPPNNVMPTAEDGVGVGGSRALHFYRDTTVGNAHQDHAIQWSPVTSGVLQIDFDIKSNSTAAGRLLLVRVGTEYGYYEKPAAVESSIGINSGSNLGFTQDANAAYLKWDNTQINQYTEAGSWGSSLGANSTAWHHVTLKFYLDDSVAGKSKGTFDFIYNNGTAVNQNFTSPLTSTDPNSVAAKGISAIDFITWNSGAAGSSVWVDNLVVQAQGIPEPASLSLLTAAGFLMAGRSRR